MRPSNILHVDDDPDIRSIVEISLGLDPAFALTSCDNGEDALAKANDYVPDLILCDVMMPGLDGPAVLSRLRENARMASIPIIFMTARAQPREIERLKALGAAAVIIKPFDPMTLAETVRGHLRSARHASAAKDFGGRLRRDAATLAAFRNELADQVDPSLVPEGFQSCVHMLAGAAGVFDAQAVSANASALEEAIIEKSAGRGSSRTVETKLDALLESIEREQSS